MKYFGGTVALCMAVIVLATAPTFGQISTPSAQDLLLQLARPLEIGEGWVEVYDNANVAIAHACAWKDAEGTLHEMWVSKSGVDLPLKAPYRAVRHDPPANGPDSKVSAKAFLEAKASAYVIGSMLWFKPAPLPVGARCVETYPLKIHQSSAVRGVVIIRKYKLGAKTYCADVAGLDRATDFPLKANFTTELLEEPEWSAVPDLQLMDRVRVYYSDVLELADIRTHYAYFEVTELTPDRQSATQNMRLQEEAEQIGEGWVEVYDNANSSSVGHARAWKDEAVHREIWLLEDPYTPYTLPYGATIFRRQGQNLTDPAQINAELERRCDQSGVREPRKRTQLHLGPGLFESNRDGHRGYLVHNEQNQMIGFWVIRGTGSALRREFALLREGYDFPFSENVKLLDSGNRFANVDDEDLEAAMRDQLQDPDAKFSRVRVNLESED